MVTCKVGVCDKPTGWKSIEFCNNHQALYKRNGYPGYLPVYDFCKFCHELFLKKSARQSYCRSKQCKKRHAAETKNNSRVKNPKLYAEIHARFIENNPGYFANRSREKRYQVKADRLNHPDQIYTDLEIFERDGWICQICFEPIDRNQPWPGPLSKSIDHIYPLSKGGKDIESNVQTAHLFCNMSKHDNVM